MPEKRCPSCGETKDYSLFYRNKQSKINCSPYCKVCSNLRSTSYARENKHKIPTTGYSLKRRYGITADDYARMLEQQEHKCAICGIEQCASGRNFAVDHCHTTKVIRGLLCSNCNTSLGGFQDDIVLLQSAINYLQNVKPIPS